MSVRSCRPPEGASTRRRARRVDYIDELIAVLWESPLGDVYDHVLQDANYNIVAHAYANTTPAAGVRHQFRYHPYGQWTYENAGGGETVTTNTNARLHATHGWQGLWFDQESGLVYVRGRYYDPLSGRFLSRDPNGQALVLSQALRMNARSPLASSAFNEDAQYGDGLSIYELARGNPHRYMDPSGLAADPANHITPCYLGGAQKGPKIEMQPQDHQAFHNALHLQGFGTKETTDEFWGKRPLSGPRGGRSTNYVFQDEDRRRVLLSALHEGGFDTNDPQLRKVVDQSLTVADGNPKRTKGRRGGGEITHYSGYRRRWEWQQGAGGRVKVTRTGPTSRARQIAGASAIGGAFFLMNLPNNAAAAYYDELTALSDKVSRRQFGATLVDEIDALAIIGDLNGELTGNIFTLYGAWNAWRETNGVSASEERNFWWARD